MCRLTGSQGRTWHSDKGQKLCKSPSEGALGLGGSVSLVCLLRGQPCLGRLYLGTLIIGFLTCLLIVCNFYFGACHRVVLDVCFFKVKLCFNVIQT